ncbi:MAG: FimB/Mfa2 family fimbrial subunit [Bacteroides sp.]|nr:FimB/Mfa2 family fimbrial subunit [Bacteroides sp.]
MKKLTPILLSLLLCTACINDDLGMCAGKMYFHFSYIEGGVNRFYERQKADMNIHFYHVGETKKYREETVKIAAVGPQSHFTIEKMPADVDSLEFISWSTDPAVDHICTPDTPMSEGCMQLKEMTEGSDICRPVEDLFYGRTKIHAGGRLDRNNITVPYERPICRMRLRLNPANADTHAVQPGPEAYIFHAYGTLNRISDENIPGGETIVLCPKGYLDQETEMIVTDWFGAFPSPEGHCLRIEVYMRDRHIANFDCADIQLSSTAGSIIDLEINAKYIYRK